MLVATLELTDLGYNSSCIGSKLSVNQGHKMDISLAVMLLVFRSALATLAYPYCCSCDVGVGDLTRELLLSCKKASNKEKNRELSLNQHLCILYFWSYLSWHCIFQQFMASFVFPLYPLCVYLLAFSVWWSKSWKGKGQIRVVKGAEWRIQGGKSPISSVGRFFNQMQGLMLIHKAQWICMWYESFGLKIHMHMSSLVMRWLLLIV